MNDAGDIVRLDITDLTEGETENEDFLDVYIWPDDDVVPLGINDLREVEDESENVAAKEDLFPDKDWLGGVSEESEDLSDLIENGETGPVSGSDLIDVDISEFADELLTEANTDDNALLQGIKSAGYGETFTGLQAKSDGGGEHEFADFDEAELKTMRIFLDPDGRVSMPQGQEDALLEAEDKFLQAEDKAQLIDSLAECLKSNLGFTVADIFVKRGAVGLPADFVKHGAQQEGRQEIFFAANSPAAAFIEGNRIFADIADIGDKPEYAADVEMCRSAGYDFLIPVMFSDKLVAIAGLGGGSQKPSAEAAGLGLSICGAAGVILHLFLERENLLGEIAALKSGTPAAGAQGAASPAVNSETKALHDKINAMLKEAKAAGEPATLLMLSVRNFGRFSKEQMDEILTNMKDAIISRITGKDIAARYGRSRVLAVTIGQDKKTTLQLGLAVRNYIVDMASDVLISFLCVQYPNDGEDLQELLDAIK